MYNEYPMQGSASSFMHKIYAWMGFALMITAGMAYYVASQTMLHVALAKSPWISFGIFFAQIGLVIAISSATRSRMSYQLTAVLFILYTLSVGLTTSIIFLVYTQASIYMTFLIAAGMFLGMSLYGYLTKADLTAAGNIALMLVWGLLLGLLINMFMQSEAFNYILSAIGVFVFTILTAYDTQKLKNLGQDLIADRETTGKIAIYGALVLYLDFINLFLFLLQFMGQRREN